MGKQINFYVEKEIEEQFIKEVFDRGFEIVTADLINKKLVIFQESREANSTFTTLYLYKKEYGNLIIDDKCDYRLNSTFSPVIEFSRTIINHEKRRIMRGRLWMATQYYAENGDKTYKNEKLIKEYESLVRWLKKYVPYQEVALGEYIVKEYITDKVKALADSGYRLM